MGQLGEGDNGVVVFTFVKQIPIDKDANGRKPNVSIPINNKEQTHTNQWPYNGRRPREWWGTPPYYEEVESSAPDPEDWSQER